MPARVHALGDATGICGFSGSSAALCVTLHHVAREKVALSRKRNVSLHSETNRFGRIWLSK
jgi:hypothetical protein